MYEKLISRKSTVLGYRITGPLKQEEVRQIAAELQETISQYQRIGILLDLQAFPYGELAAFWEDLKFDVKYAHAIDRLALVGGGKIEEWVTKLFGMLTSTECRCFAENRLTDAWTWVLEEGGD